MCVCVCVCLCAPCEFPLYHVSAFLDEFRSYFLVIFPSCMVSPESPSQISFMYGSPCEPWSYFLRASLVGSGCSVQVTSTYIVPKIGKDRSIRHPSTGSHNSLPGHQCACSTQKRKNNSDFGKQKGSFWAQVHTMAQGVGLGDLGDSLLVTL